MHFTWIDYPAQYKDAIETWCDDPVIRFALDSDSVKTEHQWYLDSDSFAYNRNYFCKIALDGETPVALLMLAIRGGIVYLDTLIVNPALRNRGYGARIVAEAIENAERLIGSRDNVFVAQIHKDNEISKKLAHKLGFHFIYTDAEANDDWFDWVYPASAAKDVLALRDAGNEIAEENF